MFSIIKFKKFFILVIIENTPGYNLFQVILLQLGDLGFNIKYFRGHDYNEGANMSGKY